MDRCIEVSTKALACLLVFGVSSVFAEGKAVKNKVGTATSTKVVKKKVVTATGAKVDKKKVAKTDKKKAVTATQVKKNCDDAVAALKGFTIGLDVVYSHTDARHDVNPAVMNGFPGGINPVDTESSQISHSRCFVDPSVNIGYSYLKDNFYAGISGDVSFGKKAEVTYDLSTSGKTEATTEIGRFSGDVKLKGGYYAHSLKSVFYGIAGVKWRKINFRYIENGTEGSKAKVKTPFFLLGLGMERPVYNKLSFSAEYECAWRNSKKTSTVGSTSVDVDQRLRENTLKLGVKYHI